MVAGLEVAIVLRAKHGQTLMAQTRGVDVKSAVEASGEVAELLFSHANRQHDDDGTSDNPPGYTSGDMSAANSMFRVVYRLVGKVYVMAVAPATCNIFFSTQLVNSAVHNLCRLYKSRGDQLNVDLFTPRFPEIYLAISALLANGGQAKSAKAVASKNVDTISSETTKTIKQLKRGMANPVARILGKGPRVIQQEAAPVYMDNRSLAQHVDPLTSVSWALPPDALPPLPYVAREAASAAPVVGWDMAGYRLQPLSPTASEVAEEEAKMGELGPQEPINGELWSKYPNGERPDAPGIEDMDFPATPSGPKGLWLEELWRCHVVGQTIKQAGTLGTVLGTAPLTKDHLKTVFRLRKPAGVSVALQKCLDAAKANLTVTVRQEGWQDTGCHVAAFDSTFGIELPVFMHYPLPAAVLPPPIQVRFAALLSEPAEGKKRRRLTMLLRYMVRPAGLLPLYGTVVDMHVHPHFGKPQKVSPAATWNRKQHQLQWRLPTLNPGDCGDIKVLFEPDASSDLRLAAAAAAAALAAGNGQSGTHSAIPFGGITAAAVKEALVRIRFTGPPRSSLSGTILEAGLAVETLQPVPQQEFFGEVTAQAELVAMPLPMPPLPTPPEPEAQPQAAAGDTEMATADARPSNRGDSDGNGDGDRVHDDDDGRCMEEGAIEMQTIPEPETDMPESSPPESPRPQTAPILKPSQPLSADLFSEPYKPHGPQTSQVDNTKDPEPEEMVHL